MNHTPIPTKKFAEIMKLVPICTVDVLFLNKEKNKILLFKRTNEPLKGIYFSMGGRLLKNEKMLDGAKRQVSRELGIKLKNKDLVFCGVQEDIHSNSAFKGATYHAVDIFYYTIVDEKTFVPKLDAQHSDCKWFSVKDKKLHRFVKERLNSIK